MIQPPNVLTPRPTPTARLTYVLHLQRENGTGTIFRVTKSKGCRLTNMLLEYVEEQSSVIYRLNWNISDMALAGDLMLTCNPYNILLESDLTHGPKHCMMETTQLYWVIKAVDIADVSHDKLSSVLRTEYRLHGYRFVMTSYTV